MTRTTGTISLANVAERLSEKAAPGQCALSMVIRIRLAMALLRLAGWVGGFTKIEMIFGEIIE